MKGKQQAHIMLEVTERVGGDVKSFFHTDSYACKN
jgi:hypothetical protein